MYCKVCNKEVESFNNGACPYCGGRVFTDEKPEEPDNGYSAENTKPDYNQISGQRRINQTPYLVFAILSTVLCCLPLGIPAIVFAAKIGGTQESGNYREAQENAKKAKMFTILAAVLGVVGVIAYFALVFFGVVAGLSGSYGYY